jgi:hypothetical protein
VTRWRLIARNARAASDGRTQATNGILRLYSARTTSSAASVFERRSVSANRWTILGLSTATAMP